MTFLDSIKSSLAVYVLMFTILIHAHKTHTNKQIKYTSNIFSGQMFCGKWNSLNICVANLQDTKQTEDSLFTAPFNNEQNVLDLMSLLDLRVGFNRYIAIVSWKFYGPAIVDAPPLVLVYCLGSGVFAMHHPKKFICRLDLIITKQNTYTDLITDQSMIKSSIVWYE